MEIVTETLKNAVAIAGNAVERGATLPILAHLLCTVDTDRQRMRITGSNMEQTITAEIGVDKLGKESAQFTLPHDKIRSILAATKAETLKLSAGKEHATVVAGGARFRLAVLPAEDYPLPATKERKKIVVAGPALRRALESVIPAAAIPGKEVRYYLCGVFLDHDGDRLHMVATDGHRMHVASLPHEAERFSAILPRRTAMALARFAGDENIAIALSETDMDAEIGEIRIQSKMVDGRYPDWRKVIPTGERTHAICNALELQRSIGACAVLSNEDYRGIKIAFAPDGEPPGLHLSATNKQQEQSDDHLSAEITGTATEIGFAVDYLSQALGALDGHNADIVIADSDAAILRGSAESETDTYAIVMAMRI